MFSNLTHLHSHKILGDGFSRFFDTPRDIVPQWGTAVPQSTLVQVGRAARENYVGMNMKANLHVSWIYKGPQE